MNYSRPDRLRLTLLTAFYLTAQGHAAENLKTNRLECEVTNSSTSTLISAKTKDSKSPVTLRLDWSSGTTTPQAFHNKPLKDNALISSHRLDDITITRTILASQESDAIFLHVHADRPGVLHFTTRFESDEPAKIVDRRQLVLSENGNLSHAWVIPFESDVESVEKSTITLSGEGEALIVFNLTVAPEKHPIADTWQRLGKKHDPSHIPPSPHLIWQGIQNERSGSSGKSEKR